MSATPARTEPDRDAAEKEMLCGWLDFHRATAVLKLEGLSTEDLWRPMVPTGTCLIGLVKHLARAEHYWFTWMFAGGDGGVSRPNQPDDFVASPDETVADVVDLYHRVCDESRRIVAEASLEDRGRGLVKNRRGPADDFTLRWIITHMIEETARHNGHADIIRELIDGATGT